jgi:uncharacterized protein
MPGSHTYPGVYVVEIPSGVHAIAGVSTSNTAFIDFFARGPVNTAVQITSFADFERTFGGLDTRSEASYAIQQYYLNGGQIAWVVRVVSGAPQPAQIILQGGSPAQNTLTVQALNPGSWGNNLQVAVVLLPNGTAFNLAVREAVTVNGRTTVLNSEVFRNLTMGKSQPTYALSVVNAGSQLVQLIDSGLGDLPIGSSPTANGGTPDAAYQSLQNGIDGSQPDSTALKGDPLAKSGLYALDAIDPFIFNILCLPAAATLDTASASLQTPIMADLYNTAAAYCEAKRAILIVDIPPYVNTPARMVTWFTANSLATPNAAVYYPRLTIVDPNNGNRARDVGASGTMAGVYARTDAARGVWKAPAGTDAGLRGANLAVTLNDLENGELNPLGINVLRNFPVFGNISWGARTLEGADQQASEWKYISVRRTAMFIEESLYLSLKWVVFEPNDEPLWSQVRLNVGAFMQDLFRQGAFQGASPRDAYFVKCDKDTTTQSDIDNGIVNILVGFAPLKPAEFVVVQIQQIAGQSQS